MEGVSRDLNAALPKDFLPVVHVEVLAKKSSTERRVDLVQHVQKFLQEKNCCFSNVTVDRFDDPYLQANVETIAVCDTEHFYKDKQKIPLVGPHVHTHVYQLHDEGASQEELEEEEDLAAAQHWLLPATEYHGLWDSLIFDSHIKAELLQYASSTLLFSDKNVDCNIISWNRVILLHGPPGTGKTSLCKALAQKLSIQLSDRYTYGQLVEINSHSLFSKWFSESGKLVMKMFQKIGEFIEEADTLVLVLIDEVESLTAARKAAMCGTEPSDAIRVVNALLTQLDDIKRHPNVLILTTSNITGAIDLAFVDRADIKQYIGLPSAEAIYSIYLSCLTELMKKKIVRGENLLERQQLVKMGAVENETTAASRRLWQGAQASVGLSGRTLRKLPFIAHATYVQTPTTSLGQFLEALFLAVHKQFQERADLAKDT